MDVQGVQRRVNGRLTVLVAWQHVVRRLLYSVWAWHTDGNQGPTTSRRQTLRGCSTGVLGVVQGVVQGRSRAVQGCSRAVQGCSRPFKARSRLFKARSRLFKGVVQRGCSRGGGRRFFGGRSRVGAKSGILPKRPNAVWDLPRFPY